MISSWFIYGYTTSESITKSGAYWFLYYIIVESKSVVLIGSYIVTYRIVVHIYWDNVSNTLNSVLIRVYDLIRFGIGNCDNKLRRKSHEIFHSTVKYMYCRIVAHYNTTLHTAQLLGVFYSVLRLIVLTNIIMWLKIFKVEGRNVM